ncbi:hypothetical protein B0H14DRAFT_3436044 [Mycena olivaceomarginata]|nr:hypothetical protein B0H14DRAFT_3436044 [Mycena olivaceomarginata]
MAGILKSVVWSRTAKNTHFLFTVPGLHDEILPATLVRTYADFNVTLIFAEGMPAYVPAYYNNFAQHMNKHDNSGLSWAYLEEGEFASHLVYPDTLHPADSASFCVNDHEVVERYLAPGMVAVSSFYYENAERLAEEELRRSVRYARQRMEQRRGAKVDHALLDTKARAKFATKRKALDDAAAAAAKKPEEGEVSGDAIPMAVVSSHQYRLPQQLPHQHAMAATASPVSREITAKYTIRSPRDDSFDFHARHPHPHHREELFFYHHLAWSGPVEQKKPQPLLLSAHGYYTPAVNVLDGAAAADPCIPANSANLVHYQLDGDVQRSCSTNAVYGFQQAQQYEPTPSQTSPPGLWDTASNGHSNSNYYSSLALSHSTFAAQSHSHHSGSPALTHSRSRSGALNTHAQWLIIAGLDRSRLSLCFSDGKDGVTEILEYMKAGEADGDEGEEEEPAMEFDFDKKEVLAAAELLERALRFRPDFEAALPLGNQLRKFRGELKQEIEENKNKVQTHISSFFSPVV